LSLEFVSKAIETRLKQPWHTPFFRAPRLFQPCFAFSNPLRHALHIWLAVAAVVCIRTVVAPDTHTIFPILAGSATHWWADQPLYAQYPPLDYFRYPPAFAVAFTPFSILGYRAGGVLWSLLGVGVFILGLWRFIRDAAPGEWTAARQAVFLALGALGAMRGLWNAQSNALAVGLLLLATAALVRRRWWTAAAALAASVLIKLTPLAPALLLCAIQPRRLPARFLLFLALGLLAPFLTRPPEIVLGHYREWLSHMAATGSERWPGFRDGWTVWLVLRDLLQGRAGAPALRAPLDSGVYRAVQLLTAAAALGWCLWQQQRIDDPRKLTTVTLAMGLAWLMLFGPAVEHATYVFLTPVLNWALLQRDWRRGRWLIGAAFVLVMFLGWTVISPNIMETAPVLLTALPVGTALFTLWLIGYAPIYLRVNQYAQAMSTPCNGNRSQMSAAGNCG
jgi:hypothetical protein